MFRFTKKRRQTFARIIVGLLVVAMLLTTVAYMLT
jgi:hypothetical protein